MIELLEMFGWVFCSGFQLHSYNQHIFAGSYFVRFFEVDFSEMYVLPIKNSDEKLCPKNNETFSTQFGVDLWLAQLFRFFRSFVRTRSKKKAKKYQYLPKRVQFSEKMK